MSREIKFRIYDTDEKEMFYQEDIDYIDFITGIVFIHQEDGYDYLLDYKSDDGKLMQYTGLKDKNGKEIYEGDILGRHEYWPIRIEYDKGCFMVRDLDKVRYNNLILNVPICNFESINDWKVIGNIYENPELLEGER
ncbi:TPA: hypothetical protein I9061_002710 [Clostridium perfringens]|nr:hypothetical protein [Clostridium perfringens]